jgi:hypothetical protein
MACRIGGGAEKRHGLARIRQRFAGEVAQWPALTADHTRFTTTKMRDRGEVL